MLFDNDKQYWHTNLFGHTFRTEIKLLAYLVHYLIVLPVYILSTWIIGYHIIWLISPTMSFPPTVLSDWLSLLIVGWFFWQVITFLTKRG